MKFSVGTSQKVLRTVTACASAAAVAVLCVGPFVSSASAAPNPGSPRDDYYLPENFVAPIFPPLIVTTTTIAASGTGRSGTPGAAPRTIGPDSRAVDSDGGDAGSEADPSPYGGVPNEGTAPDEGDDYVGPCDNLDLQQEVPCPEETTTTTVPGSTGTQGSPGCGNDPASALYQPCPEETTTTTVPAPTTSTTVPESISSNNAPSDELWDEPAANSPPATDSKSGPTGVLAFTGSSSTLLFLGVGVLLAGAAVLVLARLVRSRRVV
jgi:hypothetical protein